MNRAQRYVLFASIPVFALVFFHPPWRYDVVPLEEARALAAMEVTGWRLPPEGRDLELATRTSRNQRGDIVFVAITSPPLRAHIALDVLAAELAGAGVALALTLYALNSRPHATSP